MQSRGQLVEVNCQAVGRSVNVSELHRPLGFPSGLFATRAGGSGGAKVRVKTEPH